MRRTALSEVTSRRPPGTLPPPLQQRPARHSRSSAGHNLTVMRAVQITRFGGPEVLDVVDLPGRPATACSGSPRADLADPQDVDAAEPTRVCEADPAHVFHWRLGVFEALAVTLLCRLAPAGAQPPVTPARAGWCH